LDEQALWCVERVLRQKAGPVTHDDLRDGAYALAVQQFVNTNDLNEVLHTNDLNEVLQRVWNLAFWKNQRGLRVTATHVSLVTA
jgi:hypothetical protein